MNKIELDTLQKFFSWSEENRRFFYNNTDLRKFLETTKQNFIIHSNTKIINDSLILDKNSEIYKESIHIQGDLILNAKNIHLIINGHLTVDGDIIALDHDYSLLFVSGDLKCKNLILHGELIVLGQATVNDTVLAIGNDYSTVCGHLSCQLNILTSDRCDFYGSSSIIETRDEFSLTEDTKQFLNETLLNTVGLSKIKSFFAVRGCTW